MNDENDIEYELDEISYCASKLAKATDDVSRSGHRYALGMAVSAAGIVGASDQQVKEAIAAGSP